MFTGNEGDSFVGMGGEGAAGFGDAAGAAASTGAAVALGASTLGFGLAAYEIMAGLQQGQTIMETAHLKSQIQDLNARFSELDAYHSLVKGEGEAAQEGDKIDEMIGAQRSGYAKNGIDVNSGTAAQVQADTRITGMMNVLNIQKQARDQAQGYLNNALNERLGSSVTTQQGALSATGAQASGILKGVNTGLTGYWRTGGYGMGYPRSTSNDPDQEIG